MGNESEGKRKKGKINKMWKYNKSKEQRKEKEI